MPSHDQPLSSTPENVERFGMVTELRPEKAEYHRKLHANPWPGVMGMLEACGIRNYRIFEQEIAGRHYLFSYFECVGQGFASDMKRMAADPETRRWRKDTDPCQVPLPGTASEGKIWREMSPVFFLP